VNQKIKKERIMKTYEILPLLLLLFTVSIFGQMGFPPNEKDRVKELKEKLLLTADQTKKVEAIFDNNRKKMDALFENGDRDGADPREMMDAMMNATDKEIEKVLTKKQKEKYSKIVQDRKKEMERMQPPPPQGRFEDERGMMRPERRLGFQNRMERLEEFVGSEMHRPLLPHMGELSRDKNMCPGCCCMESDNYMPPEPLEEDDELFDL
jgi:protein CpxP